MIRVDNSGSSSALIQVRGLNKTYKRGGEDISGAAGTESRRGQRRLCGVHGPQRFGQDDAAQFAGRPRCAHITAASPSPAMK